jgi:BMFP domain-containing protein YqiC
MMDLRMIDDLTRRLGDALPPGLTQKKDEMENQFRAVLTTAFERMNLVGRDEFDAQCAMLEEARQKIGELQQRLQQLEES